MGFIEKFNETLKALQTKNAETPFERAIVAYYGEVEDWADYWLPKDGNDAILYYSMITVLTNWMLSVLRHPTAHNHTLDIKEDLNHISYIASLIEAVNKEYIKYIYNK